MPTTRKRPSAPARALPQPEEEPEKDTITLECPICMEEMVEPKVLHCGHNLCAECPETMWKRSGRAGPRSMWELACPLCKRVTAVKERDELATNFGLKGTFIH